MPNKNEAAPTLIIGGPFPEALARGALVVQSKTFEMLKMGGSIASYATDNATPKLPFWLIVFKNIQVFFLGSDDFPAEAKVAATRDLNGVLRAGWPGFEIGERLPLTDIALAHELGNTRGGAGVLW